MSDDSTESAFIPKHQWTLGDGAGKRPQRGRVVLICCVVAIAVVGMYVRWGGFPLSWGDGDSGVSGWLIAMAISFLVIGAVVAPCVWLYRRGDRRNRKRFPQALLVRRVQVAPDGLSLTLVADADGLFMVAGSGRKAFQTFAARWSQIAAIEPALVQAAPLALAWNGLSIRLKEGQYRDFLVLNRWDLGTSTKLRDETLELLRRQLPRQN